MSRTWPRMAPSEARTTATPVSSQLLSMPSTSASLAVATPACRPQPFVELCNTDCRPSHLSYHVWLTTAIRIFDCTAAT